MTDTYNPLFATQSSIEPYPLPTEAESAICGGCANVISMGPKDWVHEDSDQRGCERAFPVLTLIPFSELEQRLFWLGVDGSHKAFELSRRLWNGASDEEIAEAQNVPLRSITKMPRK